MEKGTVVTNLGIAVLVKTATQNDLFLPVGFKQELVVGDAVEIDGGKIHVLERRNQLRRSTVKKGNQTMAANLDCVALVICDRPESTSVFIEQAIIAIKMDGIDPLIVVNKGELEENQLLHERRSAEYQGLVPCLLVSANTGLGIESLSNHIRTKGRCIFVGVSGVGKSSLTNKMHFQAQAPTGEISRHSGRHTTSKSTLHSLEGGGELIDSPGVRNFSPVNLTSQDLATYFTGFSALVGKGCKFRNCLHVNEPDCMIKEAVRKSTLPTARYDLYLQMLHTLRS